MSKNPDKQESLRTAAEAQLRRHTPVTTAPVRSTEELLHELQVCQIQLEMQNEALRESQAALEKSRDRYVDLYEFAPVGYLTLTRAALIAEINLTGAALLGEERSRLIRRRFATLVAPEDRDRWHQNFMSTLRHNDKQSCELMLQRSDGSRFHVQLDSLYLEKKDDPPMVRLTLTDITERKRAKWSEVSYQSVVSALSEGIVSNGRDGAIMAWNQAAERILGLSGDQIQGRTALDPRWQAIHEDGTPFPGETHPSSEVLRTGVPQSNVIMGIHKPDGALRWISINAVPIFDPGDPLPSAVVVSFSDITERNQAQAREHSLRHILDSTLDMIFIFSPDTLRLLYVNKGAIKGIGYSREELLQMSPLDSILLVPEPECRAFIAPLISGKKEKLRFETMLKRKNGSDLPVEVQLQLIQEKGDSSLFVAVVRDIAKRKFAEKALRRQKNLMWQVIDMDPNMIFVKDAAGKFLLANQTVADFYGVPVRNLIGKENWELNPNQQEASDFLVSDREVIDSKREVTSTESALMPDGRQHWYLTVKRPLLQADGSVNVLGIAVDVSDLKLSGIKLAESYRELQRLALYLENVRAEERGRIARNLHDEMGATLAAVKMRVAWLASRLPADMPLLSTETEHISELVSAGIQTLRQVVTDLHPNLLDDVGLVAAVKDYVKRFQHDTEIECTLVLPEEGFTLNADQSVTVFRIIQESLNNVTKHAQASKVDIRFALCSESLLLLIEDNGIGFELTHKEQSFGLLGIKERALMIGGEATIASTPGQGTRVSLSIPLAP